MREFAEAEIVIPDGPYQGRRFRCDRQPFVGLWFDAIDSGKWTTYVATGPSQSGKTLSGYVIPTVYHLFEIGETVILGLPDMVMARDKWREDIEPVISRSRYRDLLPRSGAGSRGGTFDAIKFNNGATLKFMSGGGDDKSRAGFSSRVLVITETDGMDAAGEASREADKITQLRARTESYDARARTYMECTVSIEQGRTWREYTGGTQSRIALPCPHCRCWVAPEREHLQGWQDAATDLDARAAAQFCCPACGVLWSDAERSAANHAGKMVHRGQDIDPDGVIHGESPRTSTLGFRWSAVNNLFWSQGHIGAREWRAARDPDEENAAKEMLQFVWALPHQPDALETTPLEFEAVKRRVQVLPKGVAPADTQVITVGADLGKWLGHFVAIAWRADGSSHVLDYGVFEIDTDHLGVERATLAALRTFRDFIAAGWAKEDGGTIRARQVWIDSGYSESRAAVYLFCRESAGQRFRPVKGYGAGQERNRYYQQPKAKNKQVRFIGEGFHVSKLDQERVYLVEVNADHWKSWVHERLVSPVGSPGAMVLYQALPGEHTKFAKHMTAEKQVEEFVPERGVLRVWKRVRKQNHLFDAIYNACAAGNFCGVRLLKTEKVPRKAPRSNVETVRAVEDDYGEVDRRDFFVMEQE